VLFRSNIIHRVPELSARLNSSLEASRTSLITCCLNWLAARKDVSGFIVVFDGDSSVLGDKAQSKAGVRVVYTDTGESADSRIIGLVGEYAGTHECVVVSDDQAVVTGTRAGGGSVMTAGEFAGILTRSARRAQGRPGEIGKNGLSPAMEREISERLKLEWGIK
jgi:predicted RNA-binding protein with PIN domain